MGKYMEIMAIPTEAKVKMSVVHQNNQSWKCYCLQTIGLSLAEVQGNSVCSLLLHFWQNSNQILFKALAMKLGPKETFSFIK